MLHGLLEQHKVHLGLCLIILNQFLIQNLLELCNFSLKICWVLSEVLRDKVCEYAWLRVRVLVFSWLTEELHISIMEVLLENLTILRVYHSVLECSLHLMRPHSQYIKCIVSIVLLIAS